MIELSNELNVYFPLNHLNPQGWISEFITPILSRGERKKSVLARLFYDKTFPGTPTQLALYNALRKGLGTDASFNKFIVERAGEKEDKFIFLNGRFLDIFEIDETLKGQSVSSKDLQDYLLFMSSMKPYQAAFLQPYVKLQYGYKKTPRDKFQFIDFPFKQKYDLDFILNNKNARSEGCGILDISVENKFNLSTHINSMIDIKFVFGNMNVLTQEINEQGTPCRKGETKLPYGLSFMKLVTNLDTKKEIIRLEYGRKVANGITGVSDHLISVIEAKEKKVYLLNKFKHDFGFDEKGVISLGVSFYNFHDTSLRAVNDISKPAPTSKNIENLKIKKESLDKLKRLGDLKNQSKLLDEQLRNSKTEHEVGEISKIEQKRKEFKIKDITKDLSRTNKTIALLMSGLKNELTTVFLDQIKSQGQLFSVRFNTIKTPSDEFIIKTIFSIVHPDNGDFVDLVQNTSTYNSSKFKENATIKEFIKTNKAGTEELLTRIFARIFNAPYDEKVKTSHYGNIMFFPLKALLSAGYMFLEKEEKVSLPHMMFGSVLMKVGEETCSVNIGDLLVETGVFQQWYYNKFFKKDLLEYSFGAFITDILTDLVPEILYRNRVGFDDKSPTTAIKQTQFYLKSPPPKDLVEQVYFSSDETNLRKLSELISKNPTDKALPLIYHGQINNKTSQISSPMFTNLGNSEFKFDEIEDSKRGIIHIKIGADGGAVTAMNFMAQDFTKIRSALALEALSNKESRTFFFYYQTSATMLGNNMFDYDSVICIPSNPLGIDSEENDPGIAGYYKVKETTDTFSSTNEYTTVAKADWFYNPRNNNREKTKTASIPVASGKITDSVSILMTNPVDHVIQLLENDVESIIKIEAQNVIPPETKSKEEAKKNKNVKKIKVTSLDRAEHFGKDAKLP